MSFARLLLSGVALLISGAVAQAAPLYDNINIVGGGGTQYFESVAAAGPLGNQFVSDAGGNFANQVQLLLNTNNVGDDQQPLPPDAGSFIISIVNDDPANEHNPDFGGVRLASIVVPDDVLSTDQFNGGVYTWTFSNVMLDPNTPYWVVLADACTGDDCIQTTVQWGHATDASGIGVDGTFWADNQGYTQAGGDVAAPLEMTVPEPGSLTLLGVGLLMAGCARRRRCVR